MQITRIHPQPNALLFGLKRQRARRGENGRMVHVNPLLSKFAVADDLFALLSWTQLLGFPPFLYFSADLCPAVLHQHPYCETWTSEYKHRWQSSQVKSCLRGHSGSPCSSCCCSCCKDRIGTCAAAHPTGVCVFGLFFFTVSPGVRPLLHSTIPKSCFCAFWGKN